MQAIAIDVGGTSAKGAVVDQRGKILYEKKVYSSDWKTPANVLQALAGLAQDLTKKGKQIAGVGLGMPGPCDPHTGMINFTPNLPFKKPYPLRDRLQKLVAMPVVMHNDANCAALAEVTWGAAKGASVAILIIMGTGVGGGVVINGKIFSGAGGQGGELGHMPVCYADCEHVCGAGHPGCLESYLRKEEIKEMGQRALHKRVSLVELEDMARGGNKKALSVWQDVGKHLGVGLAGVLNIFNPDVVIIGGGISHAFDLFKKQARDEALLRSFSSIVTHTKFVKARLGNDAGKLGAAKLVFDVAKR